MAVQAATPAAHLVGAPVVVVDSSLCGRERDLVEMTRPPTAWSTTARLSLPTLQGLVGGRHAWFMTAVIEAENTDSAYEALVQVALDEYRQATSGVTPALVSERLAALRAWVTSYKTWRDV